MLRKPIPGNAFSCIAYESKFWNGKPADCVSAGTIFYINLLIAFSRMIALLGIVETAELWKGKKY